jgi:hypothetical protein
MAIIPVSIATPRYIQQVKCQYIWLTDYLGVTRNDSKDMDGTCGTLLGIEFDTLTMEARLPADKLAKARHATALALQCDSLTLLQAQSLAGLLNFCASVVRLALGASSSLIYGIFSRIFRPLLFIPTAATLLPNYMMTLSGGIHSYLNTMAFTCSILYNAMTSTYIQMPPSRDWAASTSNLHTRRCYTFLLPIQLPKLSTNLHGSNIPSPCGINTPFQPGQLPRTDALIRISTPLNCGQSYTPSSGGDAFGNASELLSLQTAPLLLLAYAAIRFAALPTPHFARFSCWPQS